MFSSVKNFLSRHKRKFIATGVVIGGTVLAVQYAQRKLREYHEEQTRTFIERARRKQHFEVTESTCNKAIMGVAIPLCEQILEQHNTKPILDQLSKKPENKIELWHELKILTFTRITTLVYACSMLVVSLRIQLNILGGYLYKDATDEMGQQKYRFSNNMQQKYLSLNQHFLTDGILAMGKLIESKCRTILADYDLKQELTLADIEQICWKIQMAVNSDEEDPSSAMAKYILPQELDDDGGSEQMAKIFAETLDLLESEDAGVLNTYNVTRGFSIVIDSIAEFYSEPLLKKNGINKTASTTVTETATATTSSSANVVDITDLCNNSTKPLTKDDLNSILPSINNINQVKLPLAKLIPIVNGLAGKPFSANIKPPSLSTSLVTLFLVSDKIKTLGANIYEVFSQ